MAVARMRPHDLKQYGKPNTPAPRMHVTRLSTDWPEEVRPVSVREGDNCGGKRSGEMDVCVRVVRNAHGGSE